MEKLLKFTQGNSKLDKGISIFSLVSGVTCPGSCLCKSSSNRYTGKITDGNKTTFRCYSATQEAIYPSVRKARWHNFLLLKGKSVNEMIDLISKSLPLYSRVIRLNGAGDFFNQNILDAWLKIAELNKDRIFYCYSKSVPFIIKRLNEIPPNFKFNISLGGLYDNLAIEHKLKTVKVVFSVKEAKKLGLKIDFNDDLAWKQDKSFALLLHSTMPAGSLASKDWEKIKKSIGGYNKKRKHSAIDYK